MPSLDWSQPVDSATAARRAGGRRGYNIRRQHRAVARISQILRLLQELEAGPGTWGIRSEIARRLGVSRSTICRDFEHLRRLMNDPEYAEEYNHFCRWHRGALGQSLGPRPGATWPEMNRRQVDV